MAICRGRTRPAPLPQSVTPPEEIEARAEEEANIIDGWLQTGLNFYEAFRKMQAGEFPPALHLVGGN